MIGGLPLPLGCPSTGLCRLCKDLCMMTNHVAAERARLQSPPHWIMHDTSKFDLVIFFGLMQQLCFEFELCVD